MKKNEVNDDSKAQLGTSCQITEVCNIDGQTQVSVSYSTVGEVLADCPYSLDELNAMANKTGGRELSEIWRSLGVVTD